MTKSRGTLMLPPGEKAIVVRDRDIATTYIVQTATILFSEASLLPDQKALSLTKGQKVLARLVPGNSRVMEVATFEEVEEKQENMPESGRKVKLVDQGFVSAASLKRTDQKFSKPYVKHLSEEDIFNSSDLISDVRQNIFGNCFLLSSIIAILNKKNGADYVKSLMRQTDHHTTIVKLYDPFKRKFIYYEIKNSYYYESRRNTVNHLNLWVHILEKAYIFHAIQQIRNKEDKSLEFKRSYPSVNLMYGAGGRIAAAFEILTGESVTEFDIVNHAEISWDLKNLEYCKMVYLNLIDKHVSMTDDRILKLNQLLTAILDAPGPKEYFYATSFDFSNNEQNIVKSSENLRLVFSFLRSVMIEQVSEEDKDAFKSWYKLYCMRFELICKSSPSILKLLDDDKLILELGKFVAELTDEQVNKLKEIEAMEEVQGQYSCYINRLGEFNLPAALMDKFTDCVYKNPHDTYKNSKPGFGLYSLASHTIYSNISDALGQLGSANVLACYTKISTDVKNPGLRPNHAYAITGVKQAPHNPSVLLISLYNPWGQLGVAYSMNPEKLYIPQEKRGEGSAAFDLELSEFIQNFQMYTIGTIPSFLGFDEVKLQKMAAIKANLIKPRTAIGAVAGTLFAAVAVTGVVVVGIITAPASIPAALIIGAAGFVGAAFGVFFSTKSSAKQEEQRQIQEAYKEVVVREEKPVPLTLVPAQTISALPFNHSTKRNSITKTSDLGVFSHPDDSLAEDVHETDLVENKRGCILQKI